jgi:hypothetical protein
MHHSCNGVCGIVTLRPRIRAICCAPTGKVSNQNSNKDSLESELKQIYEFCCATGLFGSRVRLRLTAVPHSQHTLRDCHSRNPPGGFAETALFSARAFSSEADAGSREENGSNQEARVFHRFHETVKHLKLILHQGS